MATRVCLGCLLVAWRGVVGAVGVVVVWGGGLFWLARGGTCGCVWVVAAWGGVGSGWSVWGRV